MPSGPFNSQNDKWRPGAKVKSGAEKSPPARKPDSIGPGGRISPNSSSRGKQG